MIATQTQSLAFVQRNTLLSIVQILGASLFLALCSQISIPLYFTPVPLSAQTFAVMLIGATMGSKKGALAVLTYLVEGCFGLPVFASGAFGIATLLGAKCGYLFGFVAQAYLVGWFLERQDSFQSSKTFTILLLSSIFQLTLGTLWLSLYVGFPVAIVMGFLPFIFGDTLKAICVTKYLKN